MQAKMQQLELDMEQQTGSKSGKEYIKAVYCHPAYLTYMQIMEKAREFQKNIYFCFIDYAKTLTVWITINCGKFFKRWEYQITWSASWEICMEVKKQQLELGM